MSTLTIRNQDNANMAAKLHQRPPFRAEHLGSLLRPEALLDVRHAIDQGQKGKEEELRAVEDISVKDIVKEQLELGFHAVSDGEFRRHMFWYVEAPRKSTINANSSQGHILSRPRRIRGGSTPGC